MCTASIWHMCTMSMDRYCTLKYPMKYGRNKTKTMVVLKITFVWVTSIAICCPLCIMGFMDYSNVYNNGMCVISVRDFVVYGSIFAFYIPLSIMVITYTLTIQILCTNQKLMRSIVREHSMTLTSRIRKERNGQATNGTYLTPQFVPRFMDRPSVDTSVSYNASVNESCILSTSESQKEDNLDESPETPPKEEMAIPIVTTEATESERTSPNPNSIKLEDIDQECGAGVQDEGPDVVETVKVVKQRKASPIKSALSVSQPHLPSISRSRTLSSGGSQKHLLMPRARSHLSVHDLESVKNFDSLSGASSLNSMLSRENMGSGAWSEFDDPEMLEKLSQIEAEMDECLMNVEDLNENLNDEVFEETQSKRSSISGAASDSPTNNHGEGSCQNSNNRVSSYRSSSSSAKSSDAGSPLNDLQSKTFKFPSTDTFLGSNTAKCDSALFMPGIDEGAHSSHNDSSSDESSAASLKTGRPRESSKKSNKSGFSFNLKKFTTKTSAITVIPPVRISQSSPTDRDHRRSRNGSSTDSMSSDTSRFITIQLKPSGCYLYQVDCAPKTTAAALKREDTSQSSKNTSRSASPCLPKIEARDEDMNPVDITGHGEVTDDPISDGGFSQSTISACVSRKYSPHATKITSTQRPQGYASGWKTFLWRQKKAKMVNGHIKQIISKRTASNEKKASKVLGIIFAVFCVLWTPFFIVNVLSVACQDCMAALTAQMMASIVWLGYLSSLANPIIYTMFNTSFRRAFYKILTCQYKFTATRRRSRLPESMYLTNAYGWSDRRPTISGSRNFTAR